MNKKVISIILLGFLSISLVGCGNRDVINNSDNKTTSNNRFVDTGDIFGIGTIKYKVYYDSKTNIVYIADAESYRSGITTMYDKDGKPMTLEEYTRTK